MGWKQRGAEVVLERDDYVQDGWRAWLVLFGATAYFLLLNGFQASHGLFLAAFKDEWGQGESASSLPLGFFSGMTSGCGLLASYLFHILGARLCLLFGALLTLLAFLSAANATQLSYLTASLALLGFGSCLSNTAGHAVLVEYFRRWRKFALGFDRIGQSLGYLALSHFHLYILQNYGWRGSLVVLGGLWFLLLIPATFTASRRPKEFTASLSQSCRVQLLRDKYFLLFAGAHLFYGVLIVYFFYMHQLVTHKGWDEEDTTLFTTALGVGNFVARLVTTFIFQLDCTRIILLYMAGTLVWALAAWLHVWAESRAVLGVLAAFFGAGWGTMFTGSAPLMLELFGSGSMASARGYFMLIIGLSNLIWPAFAGFLRERFGVAAVFHLILALGSGALFFQSLIALLQAKERHGCFTRPPPSLSK